MSEDDRPRLRILLTRIDPALLSEGIMSWAWTLCPDAAAPAGMDEETSRGSHGRSHGYAPLHPVSAFAACERRVTVSSQNISVTSAWFTGARLTGARLTGARLRGARLRGARPCRTGACDARRVFVR